MNDEYKKYVKDLLENNSIRSTAKLLNVDHTTIQYWIKKDFNICLKNNKDEKITTFNPEYAFILGFYLGDGCISNVRRTKKLRLFNDKRYECINKYIEQCISIIFPSNKCGRVDNGGCWEIYVYNNNLIHYFPQHGKGKKHERLILLSDWQKEIIEKYPKDFIKGLIYSDGCIVYSGKYKRFEFSNRSVDIHSILDYALNLLDIKKTSTRRKSPHEDNECYNQYITTISRVEDVEHMTSFIPDKS